MCGVGVLSGRALSNLRNSLVLLAFPLPVWQVRELVTGVWHSDGTVVSRETTGVQEEEYIYFYLLLFKEYLLVLE